jgi:hypothetical protein
MIGQNSLMNWYSNRKFGNAEVFENPDGVFEKIREHFK